MKQMRIYRYRTSEENRSELGEFTFFIEGIIASTSAAPVSGTTMNLHRREIVQLRNAMELALAVLCDEAGE